MGLCGVIAKVSIPLQKDAFPRVNLLAKLAYNCTVDEATVNTNLLLEVVCGHGV